MKEQTIELDCQPGYLRPGHLIAGVIKDTGLPPRKEMDISGWIGRWVWDYSDIEKEVWENAKPLLEQRIKSLYKRGLIRYGSW
jgi:hypothetical protein